MKYPKITVHSCILLLQAQGKVTDMFNSAIKHYRDDLDLQNLIDYGQKQVRTANARVFLIYIFAFCKVIPSCFDNECVFILLMGSSTAVEGYRTWTGLRTSTLIVLKKTPAENAVQFRTPAVCSQKTR